MSRKTIMALAAALFLAACTAAPVSTSAATVRGTVMLAPLCPGPATLGETCPGKPVATAIDIFRSRDAPAASDRPYRRIRSDGNGNFEIALDPGSYWFVAQAPGGMFAKPLPVEAGPGTNAIALTIDTGMR